MTFVVLGKDNNAFFVRKIRMPSVFDAMDRSSFS